MKTLILILSLVILSNANNFLALETTTTPIQDWQNCPFLMFGFGFLSGSGLLDQIPDLQACVSNATNLKTNIEQAISQFEQKTVPSIGMGVIILGKTFGNLIDECGNTYLESRNLLRQLKNDFKNETFLLAGLQRLLDNIGVVLQDLDNSKFDYDNGDYYSAGSEAGSVAKMFLQPQNNNLALIHTKTNSTPYPFADCSEGEEVISMKHVYVEKTERNNWRFGIEAKVLRTVSVVSVKMEDYKNKFTEGKSKIYALNEKKYQAGDNFFELLDEITPFRNVNNDRINKN